MAKRDYYEVLAVGKNAGRKKPALTKSGIFASISAQHPVFVAVRLRGVFFMGQAL